MRSKRAIKLYKRSNRLRDSYDIKKESYLINLFSFELQKYDSRQRYSGKSLGSILAQVLQMSKDENK